MQAHAYSFSVHAQDNMHVVFAWPARMSLPYQPPNSPAAFQELLQECYPFFSCRITECAIYVEPPEEPVRRPSQSRCLQPAHLHHLLCSITACLPRVEEVRLVMRRRDWQLMARPNALRPLQALSQLHTLRVNYSKVSAASLQLDFNTVAVLSTLTLLTFSECGEGPLLGGGARGEASAPLDLTPLSALRRLAVLNVFPNIDAIPGCTLQARALPASLVKLLLPRCAVLNAAGCCALAACPLLATLQVGALRMGPAGAALRAHLPASKLFKLILLGVTPADLGDNVHLITCLPASAVDVSLHVRAGVAPSVQQLSQLSVLRNAHVEDLDVAIQLGSQAAYDALLASRALPSMGPTTSLLCLDLKGTHAASQPSTDQPPAIVAGASLAGHLTALSSLDTLCVGPFLFSPELLRLLLALPAPKLCNLRLMGRLEPAPAAGAAVLLTACLMQRQAAGLPPLLLETDLVDPEHAAGIEAVLRDMGRAGYQVCVPSK